MKKLAIIFPLLAFAIYLKGQPCYDFHKPYLVNKLVGCGVKDIYGYKLYGQSKSGILEAKKTYKYQIVLFGGYDYKVGICTKMNFTPMHFRILNAEDQSVIYDNEEDDYVETIGFSNENTKNVIFEITLLATDKRMKDFDENRTCFGLAIYWNKAPSMGLK